MSRYPIYVVSRGRFDHCLTARFLVKDGTPFDLVVERQEADQYAKAHPTAGLRILPASDRGLIYARNWCFEDALAKGAGRFWILDDNIWCVKRRFEGRRIPCNSDAAFRVVEDFVDRFENVAIAGMNYEMFVPNGVNPPPFLTNVHVYSCTLMNTAVPVRWRSFLNDDTDICLQVLALGWCTVLTNAFIIQKMRTMQMKGGNTGIYQGDGRLKMARSLERLWPGVVTVDRRFKRPQHRIKNAWAGFTTPLKLRADAQPVDHSMRLTQVRPIKAESLKQWAEGVMQ